MQRKNCYLGYLMVGVIFMIGLVQIAGAIMMCIGTVIVNFGNWALIAVEDLGK